MKKIKSLLLLCFMFAAMIGANAQIGIQAGFTNSVGFLNSTKQYPLLNGFSAGVTYDMEIQGPVSLQYALLFNYLTGSEDNVRYADMNLSLPVHVAYSYNLSDDFKLFAFGGPNFQYALSSNTKAGSVTVNNFELNKDLTKFDVLLGAGIGAQYGSIRMKAGYDWGLLNKLTGESAKLNTLHRNQFTLSLGYLF